MEEKSMEDRTAISFLSCFTSSSLPLHPPLAISHGLFPTSSRLGIWFPCAKARHYGEPPRRRTRIKDSFEVIGRCYFFTLFTFFVFRSKRDSRVQVGRDRAQSVLCSTLYKVIRVIGDAFFVLIDSIKINLNIENLTLQWPLISQLFNHNVQHNLEKPHIPDSCVTANTTLETCTYINHIDNFYRNVKANETLVAIIIGRESVCCDAVNR